MRKSLSGRWASGGLPRREPSFLAPSSLSPDTGSLRTGANARPCADQDGFLRQNSAAGVSRSAVASGRFPKILPSLRRHRIGIVPVLALCLGGLGIAVLAAAPYQDHPTQTARLSEPRELSRWVDIVRPLEVFSLESPDLPKEPRTYQARRFRDGGGRQDILGFGRLNEQDTFLRIGVYRPGKENVRPVPFFVDLARNAALAELSIGHSEQPQITETRFGPFEMADLDLVQNDGTKTPCLGFRSANAAAPVKISGFACGTKERPMSRPNLACLIERLDLNWAGDDRALSQFFAGTETKRNPTCSGTVMSPTPVRPNWVDQADALPPLRARKSH